MLDVRIRFSPWSRLPVTGYRPPFHALPSPLACCDPPKKKRVIVAQPPPGERADSCLAPLKQHPPAPFINQIKISKPISKLFPSEPYQIVLTEYWRMSGSGVTNRQSDVTACAINNRSKGSRCKKGSTSR